MTSNNSGAGAVFFLGTRAHYQVLQQPEFQDIENGNQSTETIYNTSTETIYQKEVDNLVDTWSYDNDVTDGNNGVKRRARRSSEAALCADMAPALLNTGSCDTPKSKSSRRRINILTYLASLARRKRRLSEQIHLGALTKCSYRESCRCLECQSSYFDCDDSDEYSSESEYDNYDLYEYEHEMKTSPQPECEDDEDDDDEVFIDSPPATKSTDCLIDPRPRDIDIDNHTESETETALHLEVAAGTPVLLSHLLTHPFTCTIQ